MSNPMHQFEIKPLYELNLLGHDISITNSTVWMLLALIAAATFFSFAVKNLSLKPTRLQAAAEMMYNLISSMINDNIGPNARAFMPFIFSLFTFVLFANLLGMLPYSFTVTSHIIVTFALASFIFIAVTIIGFVRHGTHYLALFLPNGTPKLMAPFIFLIELFAYFVRPISLSVRLAANMTAGHIVLKVIAGFVLMFPLFSVFPFGLLFILTGFEIFIAMLQAYIFTILTCVYLNDALNLH